MQKKIQAEYDALATRIAQLNKTYQVAEKEAAKADKRLKNIKQYLGIETEKQEKRKCDQKHEMSL